MEDLIILETNNGKGPNSILRIDNSTKYKDFLITKHYLSTTGDTKEVLNIQLSKEGISINNIKLSTLEFNLLKEFLKQENGY